MLVNSQLVSLPPVGILNLAMFIYLCLFTLVLKSPNGEWPITYTFTFTFDSSKNIREEFSDFHHCGEETNGNAIKELITNSVRDLGLTWYG